MDKKRSQRIHVKRRAKQRLGVELNRHLRRDLITKIQVGQLQFLERTTNRISKFLTDINSQVVILVYDRNRHELVSVLPWNGSWEQKSRVDKRIRLR